MSISNDGLHLAYSLGNSIIKKEKAGSLECAAINPDMVKACFI